MSEFFERLRERAVEIHVEDHLRSRLERGDKLRVKLGLDPTAPDLHVGHLVVLDALRAFQDDGHVVVLIVGDYTALIGDPSGRSETRPVLSREQIDANAKTYFDQIYLVLDRKRTEVHSNSEWLGAMGAADLLRLMGKATLQQVLQREDFAERLKGRNANRRARDPVSVQPGLRLGSDQSRRRDRWDRPALQPAVRPRDPEGVRTGAPGHRSVPAARGSRPARKR